MAGAPAAPGVYVAPAFCRTYILLPTALFNPASAGLQPLAQLRCAPQGCAEGRRGAAVTLREG